jgi:hypothetical protein
MSNNAKQATKPEAEASEEEIDGNSEVEYEEESEPEAEGADENDENHTINNKTQSQAPDEEEHDVESEVDAEPEAEPEAKKPAVNGNSKTPVEEQPETPTQEHSDEKRDSGVDVTDTEPAKKENIEPEPEPQEEENDSEAETELEVSSKDRPSFDRANDSVLPSDAEGEPEQQVETKEDKPVDKNAARKEEVRKQRELLRQEEAEVEAQAHDSVGGMSQAQQQRQMQGNGPQAQGQAQSQGQMQNNGAAGQAQGQGQVQAGPVQAQGQAQGQGQLALPGMQQGELVKQQPRDVQSQPQRPVQTPQRQQPQYRPLPKQAMPVVQQQPQQQQQLQSSNPYGPRAEGYRTHAIRESRIKDRPVKKDAKPSAMSIKIELDLEVEVDLYARVKGDVTIGLM